MPSGVSDTLRKDRASDGLTASEGSGESCPLSSMDIRAGKASDEREKTCH
jgi:hypothetical protein